MINWKAMQLIGTRKPGWNSPPSDVNVRGLCGGCWKANASKDGARYIKSSGGNRVKTKRSKLRFGIGIYKDKIFSPTLLRISYR